ncbi:protease SohB [Sinobacterium caligoides]|uniref:protease SohB n=1 Tax=Sinobacterium caligoides TaxID=933926 RepID=UPI000F4CDFCA|nr:protease SohB [Sinobacterium caligoides]
MDFFLEYGLFLLQAITIVVAIVLTVAGVVAASSRTPKGEDGQIEIKSLNEKYEGLKEDLDLVLLSDDELKQQAKELKKKAKEEKKARKSNEDDDKPRVFVLDFDGDIKASAVDTLREEISAVLLVAKESDEVVVRLESGGGMVHAYGLAASQLARIKSAGLKLTVCVDMVAASGGYMMACIADRILAAPFAVLGSIGVVAQLPNFHRLLKKNDVDYETFTAGEFKRTVTMFGENTEQGKSKFTEELEDTHVLFKEFVAQNRPIVDMDKVATGEAWFGLRALERHLVDELMTSDEFLMNIRKTADVFKVGLVERKTLVEKLGVGVQLGVVGAVEKVATQWINSRFMR